MNRYSTDFWRRGRYTGQALSSEPGIQVTELSLPYLPPQKTLPQSFSALMCTAQSSFPTYYLVSEHQEAWFEVPTCSDQR